MFLLAKKFDFKSSPWLCPGLLKFDRVAPLVTNPPHGNSTHSCVLIVRYNAVSLYRGTTDDWLMMSRTKDVLNDSFVCYQNLSEYIGILNIKQGFHGKPSLKKHYKT